MGTKDMDRGLVTARAPRPGILQKLHAEFGPAGTYIYFVQVFWALAAGLVPSNTCNATYTASEKEQYKVYVYMHDPEAYTAGQTRIRDTCTMACLLQQGKAPGLM